MAILLALVTGCGSRVPGTSSDASGPQPDAAPGSWRFVGDDDGSTPAVVLSVPRIEGDQATVKVLVRGVAALQGLAFRLGFEPAQLAVQKSEASSLWANPRVARFATRAEGELWAGISHVGSHGAPATADTSAAQLEVKLNEQGKGPIALTFVAGHGLVLTPKGESTAVKWFAGRFER